WLVAMVVFFLPSAIAVRELSDIDPGAGGIYRWVRRAFGPLHGFVAGWGYWVNNLFYFPSLLVTTAAIAAYAAGPRFVHLGDNNVFIAALSLAGLWLAVGMNVVGLRVGKRLQNLGGHGTWLPGLIFVVLAIWSLTTHGSATPVTARGLVPASLDLQSINLFATMTFAFAGLELAPTLGDEIHDPSRTLRRGIAVSGLAIVAMYVLGTAAMLVALPHDTVSITNGMPQATAAMVERLGAGWLAPDRRPGRAARRGLARAGGGNRRHPARAGEPGWCRRMARGLCAAALCRRRGWRLARGVRPDPSAVADAVRRAARSGCDCDGLRDRESRRDDGEERLSGAHADHPDPVFHPLSVLVSGVPPAASPADGHYGSGGASRVRRCPLLHRARLRHAGR